MPEELVTLPDVVEVLIPPVEVELPPLLFSILILISPPLEPLLLPDVEVVELISTLPPLEPPPKKPPKKPPNPPQPPEPPTMLTMPPLEPPSGGSGGKGFGIGTGTIAICGVQQSSSSSITRRMRLTLRGFFTTCLICLMYFGCSPFTSFTDL